MSTSRKPNRFLSVTLLLTSAVALVACAGAAAPTPVPTPTEAPKPTSAPPPAPTAAALDPVAIIRAYLDTANSGNYDKALAYFADDAAALVQNGALLNSGKPQIAEWLREDVKTTRAQYKDWQVNGNSVVGLGTVSLDRFAKLGIESVQFRSEFIVENGKIRFFRPLAILTPEQAAKVQAASAPAAPKP